MRPPSHKFDSEPSLTGKLKLIMRQHQQRRNITFVSYFAEKMMWKGSIIVLYDMNNSKTSVRDSYNAKLLVWSVL